MERTEIEKIADSFLIRASAALEICGGEIGLTEKQQEKYDLLTKRKNDAKNGVDKVKPLTDNMEAELSVFQYKKDNPELPQGAKTYCKKWLNENIFHRRKDAKSKYIDKGNASEEDGFTLMCLELNLGMVYKNREYRKNEYAHGTPDLIVKKVYDNKCSWDLDTFPMWEHEIPDEKYEWQINVYGWLWGLTEGVVCYTLIDAEPESVEREIRWLSNPDEIYNKIKEMVYTKDYFLTLVGRFCPMSELDTFVEIPQADRVKEFHVKFDPAKIETIKQRVVMCRAYIKELLTKKYLKNG